MYNTFRITRAFGGLIFVGFFWWILLLFNPSFEAQAVFQDKTDPTKYISRDLTGDEKLVMRDVLKKNFRDFEFKEGKLKITLPLYQNDERMAKYTEEAKLKRGNAD